jgi:hypothetical protein
MKNVIVLLAAAVFSLAAQAPDTTVKPNFSGRWRMVKEKSEFSGFKIPDLITRVIDQRDPVMNVHTVTTADGKTTIADTVYSTDGATTDNVINGRNAQSKTYWDGAVLVVRTTMKTAKGDDEVIEDRWALSDDKQTLTTASHIETDKGQVDMTLVCARQAVK